MNEAAQNDKSQLEPVRATRKPRKQAKAKPAPQEVPAEQRLPTIDELIETRGWFTIEAKKLSVCN